MAQVVVRGSRTPCTDLPTGVERTVEYTATVKRRIFVKGFYELVRFVDDPADDDLAEVATAPAQPADPAEPPADPDEPPAGNASTEDWLTFLRGKNIDVPVNDDGETPGLKTIWQQVSGGS